MLRRHGHRGVGEHGHALPHRRPSGRGGCRGFQTSALVAAVRRGDDRAFERLYERYQRRIAAYVFGMVNDHGRAEDITQEVFVSALRRMRETERPIAFKPWIYEIAKNACIDAVPALPARRGGLLRRRRGPRRRRLRPARRAPARRPTPRSTAKQRSTTCAARSAACRETHHEILVMRELEGLSYREIGERLGMSRPSVESHALPRPPAPDRGVRRARLAASAACASRRSSPTAGERRLGARDAAPAGAPRLALPAVPARGARGGLRRRARSPRKTVARREGRRRCCRSRRSSSAGSAAGATAAARPAAGGSSSSSLAQWSATIGQHAEPISGWAKAAAVAAAVAVAGVGAGVATTHGDADVKAPRPAAAGSVPASAASAAAAAKAAGAATTGSGRATVRSSRRSAAKSSSSSSRGEARRRAAGGWRLGLGRRLRLGRRRLVEWRRVGGGERARRFRRWERERCREGRRDGAEAEGAAGPGARRPGTRRSTRPPAR